jgi:hypothetical protein
MHIVLSFPIKGDDLWKEWTGLKVLLSYQSSSNSVSNAAPALVTQITIAIISCFNTPNKLIV